MNARVSRAISVACILIGVGLSSTAWGELVGWWDFDDNVLDQSGMGNDGFLVGPTYSDNVPAAIGSGKSLDFQLDDEHVEIPADPSLDSDIFTLAMFRSGRAARALGRLRA